MQVRIFSTPTSNRRPRFDVLERRVNAWMAEHPDVTVHAVQPVAQPGFGWGHIAVAVVHDGPAST
ncbi:MAG: hypothetical protein S0880_05810 [Actinomycetota bacterium]|nr:hypothetical protein [Actinomycetota bacterium]